MLFDGSCFVNLIGNWHNVRISILEMSKDLPTQSLRVLILASLDLDKGLLVEESWFQQLVGSTQFGFTRPWLFSFSLRIRVQHRVNRARLVEVVAEVYLVETALYDWF